VSFLAEDLSSDLQRHIYYDEPDAGRLTGIFLVGALPVLTKKAIILLRLISNDA
jgi:hypothetical protein